MTAGRTQQGTSADLRRRAWLARGGCPLDAVVDAQPEPEASQADQQWAALYGRVLEQEFAARRLC